MQYRTFYKLSCKYSLLQMVWLDIFLPKLEVFWSQRHAKISCWKIFKVDNVVYLQLIYVSYFWPSITTAFLSSLTQVQSQQMHLSNTMHNNHSTCMVVPLIYMTITVDVVIISVGDSCCGSIINIRRCNVPFFIIFFIMKSNAVDAINVFYNSDP